MSEQDKRNNGGRDSPVVVVDRHSNKQLFRPTEAQEGPMSESHHKRAKAPAVPSVTEEIKNNDDHILQHELSSEKDKRNLAKNVSATQSKRESSPELFGMMTIDSKKNMMAATQPIPMRVLSKESVLVLEKDAAEKKEEEDSITEEIAELRTTSVAKSFTDWSEGEEEAGGLARTESRTSRVVTAMRHMFCCGATLATPSEHEIPSRCYEEGGI